MCECVEQRLFEAGELELVRLCNHKINMSIKFNGFFCYYFHFIVYRNLFAWFACSKGPMQTEIKRPTVAATRKGGKHRFTTKHYYFCFARWMGNFHYYRHCVHFLGWASKGGEEEKKHAPYSRLPCEMCTLFCAVFRYNLNCLWCGMLLLLLLLLSTAVTHNPSTVYDVHITSCV